MSEDEASPAAALEDLARLVEKQGGENDLTRMAREALERLEQERVKLENKRDEAEQAYRAAWARDAEAAWAAGLAFYQPFLHLDFKGFDEGTPRALQAEVALSAIAAAGWKLHTWQAGSRSGKLGTFAVAYPLFVREE